MGSISSCQSKYDIKSYKQEINSNNKYISGSNKKLPEKERLKKIKIANKNKSLNNRTHKEKNDNQIKDLSKSKIIDSYTHISFQKNNSNKFKTNSLNSFTTNNNSKNLINNKRISTTDNTKNITVSDDETIINQNSIDFINNFEQKNYKYYKKIKLKKRYLELNKDKNLNKQISINVISEENEDAINLSKINEVKKNNF